MEATNNNYQFLCNKKMVYKTNRKMENIVLKSFPHIGKQNYNMNINRLSKSFGKSLGRWVFQLMNIQTIPFSSLLLRINPGWWQRIPFLGCDDFVSSKDWKSTTASGYLHKNVIDTFVNGNIFQSLRLWVGQRTEGELVGWLKDILLRDALE